MIPQAPNSTKPRNCGDEGSAQRSHQGTRRAAEPCQCPRGRRAEGPTPSGNGVCSLRLSSPPTLAECAQSSLDGSRRLYSGSACTQVGTDVSGGSSNGDVHSSRRVLSRQCACFTRTCCRQQPLLKSPSEPLQVAVPPAWPHQHRSTPPPGRGGDNQDRAGEKNVLILTPADASGSSCCCAKHLPPMMLVTASLPMQAVTDRRLFGRVNSGPHVSYGAGTCSSCSATTDARSASSTPRAIARRDAIWSGIS